MKISFDLTFVTQIGIVPATEQILLIPFGFTVTDHDNLVFSGHFRLDISIQTARETNFVKILSSLDF